MANQCCLGCTERHPKCHSECERYKAFRKRLDDLKAAHHEEELRRKLSGEYGEATRTRICKMKRLMDK